MEATITHTKIERQRIMSAIEILRKSAKEARFQAETRRSQGDLIGADFCEMDAGIDDDERARLEGKLAALGDRS